MHLDQISKRIKHTSAIQNSSYASNNEDMPNTSREREICKYGCKPFPLHIKSIYICSSNDMSIPGEDVK